MNLKEGVSGVFSNTDFSCVFVPIWEASKNDVRFALNLGYILPMFLEKKIKSKKNNRGWDLP